MSTKKKILMSAGIGTAAVVAGVAPAVASVTNTQSSNIDVSVDPTNPVDPVDPLVPTDPENPADPVEPVEPVDPVDPVTPVTPTYATAPDEDFFTLELAMSSTNNSELNKYFSNLSQTETLGSAYYFNKNFQNYEQYSNVKVSYVENSISNNSFEIKVVPVGNAVWQDTNNKEQKTIKVVMNNGVRLQDATVPIKPVNKTVFTASITGSNISSKSTDADLNKWLSNYFKSYKMSDFSLKILDSSDYKYANVNLSYVENSANITNKTFKIKVTPKAGHAWSSNVFYNDTVVDARTIEVSIENLGYADKIVTLPNRWGINLIMGSVFPFKTNGTHLLTWENISWFLDPQWDWYWYGNNPKYYDNKSVEYQHLLYEEAWKDLARYYPVELSGTFEECEWGYIQRLNESVTFNFKVPMKPQAGYTWSDGTTGTRLVHLNLFLSNECDVGPFILSNVSNLEYLKTFNKNQSAVSDGLPINNWVTNDLIIIGEKLTKGTWSENSQIMIDIAKSDLEKSFPNYNIEVTDMHSASPGYPYNYYGVWTYKIKFTSKTDSSYTKTMDGYIFTIN
ncbi:MAG: hypothetical protein K2J02_00525 [Malacoplasma sp.]|nr:hypothetical protein [Malacoplasma sp.]MDE7075221.1 hypothetical protein [Malacoplasma sp.]